MSLQITGVETQLLRVPLRQRAITDSQSRVEAVEFLQVVVQTNEGITGHGMNWSYTPGLHAAQVMVDDCYKSALIGADPTFRRELVRKMFFTNHFVGRVGASRVGIAAVEFALWDIACKIAGVPLWRYLGIVPRPRQGLQHRRRLAHLSVEELIADTTALVARGFDAVKIKLGRPDPREDYERVGAVRRVLGPKIRIMTDVNCAWSLPTARIWGSKLSDFDVFWLEEPMVPEDVKSHAELQRAI